MRGRGKDLCVDVQQSSRDVVLVQYTYSDGILTRVVARRRPEGICRYLPLHSSVCWVQREVDLDYQRGASLGAL